MGWPKGKMRTGYDVEPETGCWIWRTASQRGGYGAAGHPPEKAHRYMYKQLVGPIPDGHDIHHKCRNRRCVNPEHLEARLPRAHRGRNSRLSDVQRERILTLLRNGRSLDEIADELGLNYLVVSGLKLGGLFKRA